MLGAPPCGGCCRRRKESCCCCFVRGCWAATAERAAVFSTRAAAPLAPSLVTLIITSSSVIPSSSVGPGGGTHPAVRRRKRHAAVRGSGMRLGGKEGKGWAILQRRHTTDHASETHGLQRPPVRRKRERPSFALRRHTERLSAVATRQPHLGGRRRRPQICLDPSWVPPGRARPRVRSGNRPGELQRVLPRGANGE